MNVRTTATATATARRRRLLAATLAAGALTLSLTACGGSGSDAGVDKARAAGNVAPAGATAPSAAPSAAPESPAPAPEQAPAEQGGPRTSRAQAITGRPERRTRPRGALPAAASGRLRGVIPSIRSPHGRRISCQLGLLAQIFPFGSLEPIRTGRSSN